MTDELMTEPMQMEEVIDTLKGLVFGTFDRTTAKEREALDMAIKALEEQTVEDCVSRRSIYELLDSIDHVPQWVFDKFAELPSVAPNCRSRAESVEEYQVKWISVDEKLPWDLRDVLAYDGADMFVAWYDNGWHSNDDTFDRHYPIKAWIPIEPYEE